MYPDLAAEPRLQVEQGISGPQSPAEHSQMQLLQGASTIGQEPLQPCPLLAGFLGAWCGCSILPVTAVTFLKIGDL